MKTVYDLVHNAAMRTPDHKAIVDTTTGNGLTYAKLLAEIDAIAAGLRVRGIGPGDMVATIYHQLGVDSAMTVDDLRGRPIPIAHGGEPVFEALA